MDIQTEKQIVEQAKTDPVAFGTLFDNYYPAIMRYVLRRVADPSTAQDIVAETFLKAFQNIQYFRWKGLSISAWFYKIATNELRMYFRKHQFPPVSLDSLIETTGFEPISDQDLVEEQIAVQSQLERQVQYQQAHELLIKLPLKYQEVLTLRFVEKKKLAEIALILDKREGTVKSLLSRGLKQLRQQLVTPETQPNSLSSIIEGEPTLLMNPMESYEE